MCSVERIYKWLNKLHLLDDILDDRNLKPASNLKTAQTWKAVKVNFLRQCEMRAALNEGSRCLAGRSASLPEQFVKEGLGLL